MHFELILTEYQCADNVTESLRMRSIKILIHICYFITMTYYYQSPFMLYMNDSYAST